MAHAEVQSLGVYKFVLNWLSIMWLKKVRYQPQADASLQCTGNRLRARWAVAPQPLKARVVEALGKTGQIVRAPPESAQQYAGPAPDREWPAA